MFWMDAWTFGGSLWRTMIALNETAQASQAVIGHRSRTINDALHNPHEADLVELGLMVPEKMAAFTRAGAAIAEDWVGLQADLLAQAGDMAVLAMTGRLPSTEAVRRIGHRSSRMAGRMADAGGRALAPIHATATANHRRLASKKKPKARKR